ncbi:AzlC family ABC transporter permease [Nosocomiicoccus sp. HMSC09A07]|uniref:AzlC family ABC transporter permease n=1 Tax=Nosocomiicoccus sp. HMSC09A07 TaxID=1581145 RepID=UPI0009F7460D|nr:AzlC family ABC transporter permease [Nosocomiicoccus sp. HMSC09A07]
MSEVYKRSFSDGIAIGFGYLPVAMAFGITAKPLIDLLSTTLMSGLNYAGAGQFCYSKYILILSSTIEFLSVISARLGIS